MVKKQRVQVSYFSDVLCIWAYVAQIKLDEMRSQLGEEIDIRCHFISIFGDTSKKIGNGWKERGGFSGYAQHVRETAQAFPHVEVASEVWTRNIPASSAGAHVALKAVQGLCDRGELPNSPLPHYGGRTVVEAYAWRLREAFFVELRNIAESSVQLELAEQIDIPVGAIQREIESGAAYAATCADRELQEQYFVRGSPTWVLNGGRQSLYGNVGYRIIEANVKELLSDPSGDSASWC